MRFVDFGIEGLYDELRSGRKRTIDEERIAQVIRDTLDTKPEGETHWSVRTMATNSGLSKSTVQRVWNAFGVRPHRTRFFKLSTDSFFVEKVTDIVGLYLNPPDNAMVLCVDEKSQCQALERSQPILPMGLGYVEGYTSDYIRHGTTTLFSALTVATGSVLTTCKKRHRHQEFLSFLREIDKNVATDMDIHIILDNYATHKHAQIKAWLAEHPRYQFHFTPTYSSWLNQVERWFGLITEKAIRRGSFTSDKDLTNKIDAYVRTYNKTELPFQWTATTESILAKVQRLCERISGTEDYPGLFTTEIFVLAKSTQLPRNGVYRWYMSTGGMHAAAQGDEAKTERSVRRKSLQVASISGESPRRSTIPVLTCTKHAPG